jgi:hypothetical protein
MKQNSAQEIVLFAGHSESRLSKSKEQILASQAQGLRLTPETKNFQVIFNYVSCPCDRSCSHTPL